MRAGPGGGAGASITLRLTAFFALVSTLVLLALGYLIANAVEQHFVEQDLEILDGKRRLIERAVADVATPDDLVPLARRLDDARAGFSGLVLAVAFGREGKELAPDRLVFAGQGADYPKLLLDEPPSEPPRLRRWRDADDRPWRGVAVRVPGPGPLGEVRVAVADFEPMKAKVQDLLQRTGRILTQRTKDKNKLYALHAPEVECIGKGKARKPYEFGVKASIAVTHKSGLMVGARTFPGNPYDGHILSAQLEQTRILLEDVGREPKEVVVDLGFRGVDRDNPRVEIIHRGKYKSLTKQQRRWLKRRQAVEPAIGHLKSDNRMDRCWLRGQLGDALHAVLCATGYNLRWLLRAMARLGLKAVFLRPVLRALMALINGDHARFTSGHQNFRLAGAPG